MHAPDVNVSAMALDHPANLSVPVPVPVMVAEARNTTQTDPEKTVETKNMTLENVKTAENSTHTQRRLLEDSKGKGSEGVVDAGAQGATVENNNVLEDDADASFNLLRDGEDIDDEYSYDYDDYVDDSMWGDEDWKEATHQNLEDYVLVDSHILSTPVNFIIYLCFAFCFCLCFSLDKYNTWNMLHMFLNALTQVIADIDSDGVQEMVVAVSYFFDRE